MRTIYLVFGRAGSGKGTLCKRYTDEHDNIRWIESGGLIRSKLATDSEIQAIINSGNLISDEKICALIVTEIMKDNNDVILDGYPRTLKQLELLKEKLPDIKITSILIDCPESVCLIRLLNRKDDRDDDNPTAIKRRFELFNSNMKNLLPHIQSNIHIINGANERNAIYEEFRSCVY